MSDLLITQDAYQEDRFSIPEQAAVSLAGEPSDELRQMTTEYREIQKQALPTSEAEKRYLELGRRLYGWMQQRGNWAQRLCERKLGTLEFQLHPDFSGSGSVGGAVAAAPWEVLADDKGFLARRANSRFLVIRRLMNREGSYEPSEHRLSMVFMAASPHGQAELNYRGEEVSISTSAGRIGMDLVVEETGQLEQLADTLNFVRSRQGPIDVLHLSCHGLNTPEPVVALEGETGETVARRERESRLASLPAVDCRTFGRPAGQRHRLETKNTSPSGRKSFPGYQATNPHCQLRGVRRAAAGITGMHSCAPRRRFAADPRTGAYGEIESCRPVSAEISRTSTRRLLWQGVYAW